MAHKDDWFRKPNLNPVEIANFEAKLQRSRSSRHEYMRIQASSLLNAEAYLLGIKMIDRVILEDPDHFALAWLLEEKARAYRSLGERNKAIEYYRAALERTKARPSVTGNVQQEYPFWIATEKIAELYQEAMSIVIQSFDHNPMFPLTAFEQHATLAMISHELKDDEAAQSNARAALKWAERSQSNAANHRSLGLVGNLHSDVQRRLQNILEPPTSTEFPDTVVRPTLLSILKSKLSRN